MAIERSAALRIGEWVVDPVQGQISSNGKSTRVEVRSMRLLLYLAERPGQLVSIDDLISHVWAGVAVSPDSVYQAVTSLRRQLGDDPRQPSYIETVPRLGYRMIAQVRPAEEAAIESPAGRSSFPAVTTATSRRPSLLWAAATVIIVAALAFGLRSHFADSSRPPALASAAPPQVSVGVLPFLDLTEGMHNEEFADGMTEELIDKLSKIPSISVPSATSSFYYKGKQMPVAEIARGLNVTYLLDGSVRKSGGRVRIAARLLRADSSYVLWTESYDRPLDDLIMVQDNIAGEVTKALRSSIVPASPGKNP